MERSAASLFAAGSIGSVSKNSASQSYAGAGFGRFSVAQIQQGYRMLIELYDWLLAETGRMNTCAVAWFVAKYPNYAQDPDFAIWDALSYRLGNPVENYEIDLSDLRLRPTLAAGVVQTW
jgi:hypothetical protein